MFSPFVVQVSVALLAVFSVVGLAVAALYPRLVGNTRSEKRLAAIRADKRELAAQRITNEEGRRRRSVEDTLRELEETQKAKARKSQKPTLMIRMRQAGLTWTKRTYYIICSVVALIIMVLSYIVIGFGPIPTLGFGLSGGILLPHFFVNFESSCPP